MKPGVLMVTLTESVMQVQSGTGAKIFFIAHIQRRPTLGKPCVASFMDTQI